MSLILGIDTSSVDMGLGLYNNGSPVTAYSRYVMNSHAEYIAQAVTHLLSANNIQPSDIRHIAVVTGPGSFTGLRIGIAFTKGFSICDDTLICPVSSLQVLAYAARHATGPVIDAIDARNGDVFWATFEFSRDGIKRITDDRCSPSDEFYSALSDETAVVFDTMGYAKSTVFKNLDHRPHVFNIEHYPIQRGLFCAATGAALINDSSCWVHHSDLHPHYLRSSAARIPGTKV
jgi:tRNA threonylcarbamoyladenosine biosynthesis protein TsaB